MRHSAPSTRSSPNDGLPDRHRGSCNPRRPDRALWRDARPARCRIAGSGLVSTADRLLRRPDRASGRALGKPDQEPRLPSTATSALVLPRPIHFSRSTGGASRRMLTPSSHSSATISTPAPSHLTASKPGCAPIRVRCRRRSLHDRMTVAHDERRCGQAGERAADGIGREISQR